MSRPSPLTRELIEAGLARGPIRSLSELLEEHRALLTSLKHTLCFGCGVRFGDNDPDALRSSRGCISCNHKRELIAHCEAPTAEGRAA